MQALRQNILYRYLVFIMTRIVYEGASKVLFFIYAQPWLKELSNKHDLEFIAYNKVEKITSNDIFYLGFSEYANSHDFIKKYPDNRFIIGGGEAFDPFFSSLYCNDQRFFFLFADKQPGYINAKNITFAETFWWTQYFLIADTYRWPIDTSLPNHKHFLMQARSIKNKPWRKEVFDKMLDILPMGYYSRGDIQKSLPRLSSSNEYNDISENETDFDKLMYIDPMWYNTSYCSVVLETFYDETSKGFTTEKTYKPIYMNHPFMIISNPGTLKKLSQWGFVTFDNIFRESYDNMVSIKEKVKIIKSNIKNINREKRYDTETLARLKHNNRHFCNQEIIRDNITREIIYPLKEWAND